MTKALIINIIILASRKRGRESPTEVWLSLARAPGLGPGGRRFESCHPDLEININMRVWFNGRTSAFQAEYVGSIPITCFILCASGSVGGARPCQGRGRGFESRLSLEDHKKGYPKRIPFFMMFECCRAQTGSRSQSPGGLFGRC